MSAGRLVELPCPLSHCFLRRPVSHYDVGPIYVKKNGFGHGYELYTPVYGVNKYGSYRA